MNRWDSWTGGWLTAAAVGAGALGTAIVLPDLRGTLVLAANAGAVAAVVYQVARRRPVHLIGWTLIGVGFALMLAGHAVPHLVPHPGGGDVGFPSLRDGLLLAAYPSIGGGLAFSADDPDRAGLIDAAIVTTALTALAWIFLVEPIITADGIPTAARVTAVAYPLAGMIVVTLALRLAFTGALRHGSFILLAAGLAAVLAGGTAHALAAVWGRGAGASQLGWLAGSVLLGTAVLHPSVRRPVPGRSRANGSRDRLLLLAASSLVIPTAMINLFIRDRQFIVPALAVGAALMFLLALARVAGLLRDSERKAEELEYRRAELERTLVELQDAQDELLHVALHDPLTGLSNRVLLLNRLEHSLAQRDPRLGLLLLDLDGFKTINDTLGHDAGNEVLIAVADRLRSTMRPGDTVARLGGDEFALLVEGTTVRNIATVAERVRTALARPVELASGSEVLVTASIGCALNGSDTAASDILRNADIAMYAAKRAGRDSWEVFSPDMHEEVLERSRLETDLRKALERSELALHYQPIVDLQSRTLVGAEALLRWQHPTRGPVSPGEFIALAEQTGLIVPIGAWVLREACCQVREWQLAAPEAPPLKVSVNVSGRQLQSERILDDVATALEVSGLDPADLVIEITETTLMHDGDTERLEALRRLGVRLAVDDFGTGYSSLASLRRYPIDVLKVDRTFVQGVSDGPAGSALTLAIVRIAASMQLDTIAEGVETEAQAAELERMGCFQAQGFHFARPLDPAGMGALIDDLRSGARTLQGA